MKNDPSTLKAIGELTLERLSQYLESSRNSSAPVIELPSKETLASRLNARERIKYGFQDEADITDFIDTYLKHTMHLHDPRYLGHQVAVPHIASAFAELIHGVANQPMSIFEMSPAGNILEHEVIDWMVQKIGWPEGSGTMTHGGSLANLHCMLAARAHAAPDSWQSGNPKDLVVLAPGASHYSIARAIGMMGLGQDAIIPVSTDAHEVVMPKELERIIKETKAGGKQIMAVVINTCATSSGLYDPIDEIADLCNQENIWLHLDSPHGIAAILSEKYRHLLKGLEKADSLIWDAHKMMRTSTLATGALFKSKHIYQKTFQQKASYLIHEKDTAQYDTLPFQIECTKSGLAAKIFWVLAAEGESGIGAHVEQTYDLAQEAYQMISSRPGFESPFAPESNIICFTYRDGDLDQLTLREKIVADGQFYITSTEIKGKRYLRIVVMNDLSSVKTIEGLLDHIETLAGLGD